jgi:F-type H+-transporting ATPase subunit a
LKEQGVASPLKQFEIVTYVPIEIGGVNLSFTNSSAFMVIAVVASAGFMMLAMRRGAIVPGRMQTAAEAVYEFVGGLIRETIGAEGRRYFPLLFTLFMFILLGNMLGMIPYSFTFTSHIIVTFVMAFVVFAAVTVLGFTRHGFHFFTFFVPPGAPLWMWPLLIPIEIISYFSRPISLSVRLFANMLAGHTMLKVIAGFVLPLSGVVVAPVGWALGLLPLMLVIALTGLEILIAFLQAYVFTILTCLYIKDSLDLHSARRRATHNDNNPFNGA